MRCFCGRERHILTRPVMTNHRQIKIHLTVIVNGEGHIWSDDVIEANLAVLRRAVSIQSLHAHNPVEQAALWDRGLVATLDKHWGELVDVIHAHVHGGPGGEAKQQTGTE